MKRYQDEIIILKPMDGGTPYSAAAFQQVYRGRCRCFLDRQAAFRTNRVMDCTYQVVIPDRFMVDIGENFKVGIKLHTSKSNHNWDLVGYVKDFARFDRVCNLYFQMVKENLIYEDMPPKGYDLTDRMIVEYEDKYIKAESEGLLINGEQIVCRKPIFVRFKNNEYRCVIANNVLPEEIGEEPDDEIIYEKDQNTSDGDAYETSMTYLSTVYKEDTTQDIVVIVPQYVSGYEFVPMIKIMIQEAVKNPDTQEYENKTIYEKDFVIVS